MTDTITAPLTLDAAYTSALDELTNWSEIGGRQDAWSNRAPVRAIHCAAAHSLTPASLRDLLAPVAALVDECDAAWANYNESVTEDALRQARDADAEARDRRHAAGDFGADDPASITALLAARRAAIRRVTHHEHALVAALEVLSRSDAPLDDLCATRAATADKVSAALGKVTAQINDVALLDAFIPWVRSAIAVDAATSRTAPTEADAALGQAVEAVVAALTTTP